MFLGHFGVAFAARRLAPDVPLAVLVGAAQLADLVWPVLVLAGVERVEVHPGITAVTPLDFVSYPYSHSLLALLGWAALLGIAYALVRRSGVRPSLVVGSLVVSHWVLDLVSHRPDLPLGLGRSPRFGLGLWSSLPATLLAEAGLLAVGVAVYVRATAPRDRMGRWTLVGLVAFLLVVYAASVFGPPPPSPSAVAGGALAIWLLVAWAHWVDRHRQASAPFFRGGP